MPVAAESSHNPFNHSQLKQDRTWLPRCGSSPFAPEIAFSHEFSLLPAAHQPLQAIPRAEAQCATPPGANFPDDPVFLPPTPVFRQKTAAKPAKTASQHTGNEALTSETVSLTVFGPSPPAKPEIRRNALPPGPHFPPLNSNADYNVLFREASGEGSQAQFHALADTCTWAAAAESVNQSATPDANSKRPSETKAPFLSKTLDTLLKRAYSANRYEIRMKLRTLTIRNFRCFDEVTIELGAMHVMVGANNSGKSTILRALDFLFNPSTKKINEESFCDKRTALPIEVEGIFADLTANEAEQLAPYLRPDGLFHLKRSASFTEEGCEAADEGEEGESKVVIAAAYSKPQPKADWLHPDKITGKAIDVWWADKANLKANGVSFADFIGGTKPKVIAWKEKATEFVGKHLKPVDFEESWTANPVGYAGVLKATLPLFVLIPAVRDAADESKVTKTGPFGKLIYEIMKGMDAAFRGKLGTTLKETTRLLNREGKDERAASVADVEATIKGFLGELMPVDLELEFQAPTLEVLLTTPKIFVDDGFRGSVEGKGHGLQRAVIFSILRAYAKLVTRRADATRRTLILGVEEPELYMHPPAQRTIRKLLRTIAEGGDQVIFSTHSPLLVDVTYFDEIIRCENPEPKAGEVVKPGRARRFQLPMQAMIEDITERYPSLKGKVTDGSMREQYAHAYTLSRNEGFFAKRLILVEGPTETYSLPIYAAALGHDLDALGISVVECGNKAQIDRLYRIFNEVGIACYVMFDFDRDNADKERVRESNELLTLVGAATVDKPTADVVEERFAYFVNTWEASLAAEIPDYAKLREQAKRSSASRTTVSL